MKKLLIILALAALASGCANTPANPTPAAQVAAAATALPPVGGSLRAEGKVVPARHAALSPSLGGVVRELLVAEGDTVAEGQPLLRVDQARAQAALAQAQADLAAAQASYEQLRAGATPEQIAVAAAAVAQAQAQLRQTSGGVTQSDLIAARAQLEQARAAQAQLEQGPVDADIAQAQAQLAQARASAQGQRDALAAAKLRAQAQLTQAANTLRDAQDAYSRVYWANREAERLPGDITQAQQDQEASALRAVENAEQAMAQANIALTAAQEAEVAGVAAAEAQVRDAQARLDKLVSPAAADRLAAARAQVAQAQAALDRLQGDQRAGALDVAQAAVDQATAQLALIQAGAAAGDLAVAQAQVQRAEAALALAQVGLAETELRAPFAGTVVTIAPQVGEYLAVGSAAVDLADLSTWQVETTDLTEQDIARVRAGAPVSISLDALPDLELTGTVSRIRTLGESKQGDITYTITIQLDTQDPQLRWNMTASVRFAEN